MKRIFAKLIFAVVLLVAVPAVMPVDCQAQGIITPPKPTPTPKPKPKPKPAPAVKVPDARTSWRSMDLQARRNGRYYYFNPDEWSALTSAQKALFTPEGVVMNVDDEAFVVALHNKDNGGAYRWNEAMQLYGDILPSREQGEILVKYQDILNDHLKAYGGTIMDFLYWTCTESNSNRAWRIYMGTSARLESDGKLNPGSIRAVVPMPHRPD